MVNPVSGSSSGSVNSPYSGLMRVNGLSSGMDIDGMVSSLMKAEAIPLNQMKQKQQILEWQRDDYRTMNTALNDLDTTTFDGIYMQSTFNKKTVTSSNDSVVSATAINATNNLSTQMTVSTLASSASWKSAPISNYTGTAADLQFTVTDPGSTTTRTVKFSITSSDNLDSVILKFNNSGLGVSMYKLSNGSVAMTNNKTGLGAKIVADPNTATFMNNSLGFSLDPNDSATLVTDKSGGNADLIFNGYEMTPSSNTFTVSGVSYTIKGTTSNPVSVTTATDVDSIYNSIKSFVDKYNDTIKTVNDKISEQRNRDYQPLTDDQRAAMNDTQISQWEDKAKSGMLSNDSILSSGLSKMRQNLYSPVSGSDVGQFTQLSQIGITTSSNYLDNGKLVIDENTLREKIQEDPQAIYKLFNSSGTTSDTEGLAHRLRDSLKSTMDQVTARAGNTLLTDSQYTLGTQLTDLGTQITDFQAKLSAKETQYYNQFSAMDQAMQQANQQSSYITSQFSSGG